MVSGSPDQSATNADQRLIPGAPPAVVVLTASSPAGSTRPTAISGKLSDVVKIQTARYDWANKRLLIEARSSDEVVVPDLVAQGYGRLSKSGTLQSLTLNDLDWLNTLYYATDQARQDDVLRDHPMRVETIILTLSPEVSIPLAGAFLMSPSPGRISHTFENVPFSREFLLHGDARRVKSEPEFIRMREEVLSIIHHREPAHV